MAQCSRCRPNLQLVRRLQGRRAFLTLLGILGVLLGPALRPASACTPVQFGYQDSSYPSSVGMNEEVTAEKPEAKLWFNDGFWWGSLWSTAGNAYRIHRLDPATQCWIDTGTNLDTRSGTKADALWDGTKLYVVSHTWSGTGDPAPAGQRGQLFRYSYNASTDTYSPDAGFPVQVTGGDGEALTIAKDSTGRLWVTYVESQQVMVNASSCTPTCNDASWGSPFVLPTANAANLTDDDLSAIVAFENKIGILFSNQTVMDMYFAVHPDAQAPDAGWTQATAYAPSADDHMNLKVLSGDSAGKVLAAIKTSQNSALIILLVCKTGSCNQASDWQSYTAYDSTFGATRPNLLVDVDQRQLWIATRSKVGSDGGIYLKPTSLDSPSFTLSQIGTQVIGTTAVDSVNDPTTWKGNLTNATGLVVLASDAPDQTYFHARLTFSGPTITSFTPGSGPFGTEVTITGSDFTGATHVTFNNASASFTVDSETRIRATVPAGATTGLIRVTTLGGTATSASNFSVTSSSGFTLTANVVGEGTVGLSPPGGTYASGTVVTLTATPSPGVSFAGWSGDLGGSTNPTTITMDADKVVTATFGPPATGDVTFTTVATGGATNASSVTTSEDVPAAAGEVYLASVSSKSYVNTTAVSGLGLSWVELADQCGARNQTGVALWWAQGTPSGSTPVTATFASSTGAAVIAVARYSGTPLANPLGATPNVVSANTLGVSGSCSGGTDTTSYAVPFTTQTTDALVFGAVALRAHTHTPGTGWTERAEIVAGSSGSAAGAAVEDRSFGAAGPNTITGSFASTVDWAVAAVEIRSGGTSSTPVTLSVSSSEGGQVSLSPSGGSYPLGTLVTLTALPDPGFAFTGWSGALTGIANPATLLMDANKSVFAGFSSGAQYTVTVEPATGGSVTLTPSGGAYAAGTLVTVTAVPVSGYRFGGWGGALLGTSNPTTLLVDANKTISATFIRQYTVSVSTTGGGSVSLSPSGGVYDVGTLVTLTAVPASGGSFLGWSGALSGATNPATVLVDGDKSVTANFTSSYTLSVSAKGKGSVVLSPPGGTYAAGTVVTLTAVPGSGFTFRGWSGALSGLANPTTLSMDANESVTATFKK